VDTNIKAAKIADNLLKRLTAQGFDCVNKSNSRNIRGAIHTAALYAAKDVLVSPETEQTAKLIGIIQMLGREIYKQDHSYLMGVFGDCTNGVKLNKG
jgi:hypothetical protein